ncbi:MAG: mechanosensitive ion channel family protein [Acidobacteriota bacterium]
MGVDWNAWLQPLEPYWQQVAGRPWLEIPLLLILGWVFGRLLDWLIQRLLRQVVGKTGTDVDDKILAALHRPVMLSVLMAVLALVTARLELPEPITVITWRGLATVALALWWGFALKVSNLLLDAAARHQERLRIVEQRTLPLFEILAKLLIFGGGTYLILKIWDIDAAAWLASAGVLGIAIGFAAKDSLANLFSGVFIIADAPYKLGDFVVLDSGERGQVTHVGLRSTRLLTRDDLEIILPNAVIANAKIINESGGPWEKRRVRIAVSVAYGSDIDQVLTVLGDIAERHPGLAKDPAARVRLRRFGDSGLELELLAWIDEPVERGLRTHELLREVYVRFAAEGIEIPFPQQDLRFRDELSVRVRDESSGPSTKATDGAKNGAKSGASDGDSDAPA